MVARGRRRWSFRVNGGNGNGVCDGPRALSLFILDGRGVILSVIVGVIAVGANG